MDALDLPDVDPQRRSGIALDRVHAARADHEREHRRPRALTAREALVALHFEALLVYVAACNVRAGVELSEGDMERLGVAVRRIDLITEEVAA